MRILFVTYDMYFEPLGILYLSSVLKLAGHQTEWAVINAEDTVAVARRFQPDLVAHSVHTGEQHHHLGVNDRLKQEADFFAAFGGPHPTFFPEMIENKNVDGVCQGEGEDALLELVNRLEAGQPFDGLENWWIKQNGQIQRNPPRQLILDLDQVPFPDRELMQPKESFLKHKGLRSVMTARGCPYECTYCFNPSYVKLYGSEAKRIRRRSVDNVIEELVQLKTDHDVRFVYIADDTFNVMDDWLAEFAAKYSQKVKIPFLCNIRADLVTKKRMRLIADAGAHSVCMGIETGSAHLRNTTLRRNQSDEQLKLAGKVVHDVGLKLYTTNMMAIPGGSLQDDFKTVEINQTIKPHAMFVALLQPYPRTEIRRFAESKGFLEGSVEDLPMIANQITVIRMNPKDRRQVVNLRHLSNLLVKFPWLLPRARFLIKLPLTRLYNLVHIVTLEYLTFVHIFPHVPSLRFYFRKFKSRLKVALNRY